MLTHNSVNYFVDTVFQESGIIILSNNNEFDKNINLKFCRSKNLKLEKLLKLEIDNNSSESKPSYKFSECYINPFNNYVKEGNNINRNSNDKCELLVQ